MDKMGVTVEARGGAEGQPGVLCYVPCPEMCLWGLWGFVHASCHGTCNSRERNLNSTKHGYSGLKPF